MNVRDGRAHAGRALILLGAALSVVSASLPWARVSPEAAVFTAVGPPVYISESALVRTGFQLVLGRLSVGWLLVLAGVTCAALLLWPERSAAVSAVRIASGVAVLALAAVHLGPFPGVALAMCAGALLLVGAWLVHER